MKTRNLSTGFDSVSGFPSPPVLVHADAHQGFRLLRRMGFPWKAESMAFSIVEFISSICQVETGDLVFPAFNYDFSATGVFDVEKDPVQVGAIPEALRLSGRFERTETPFFSTLHTGSAPKLEENPINPWGENSIFGRLAQERGSILLFGVGIDSLTFIHHIEASIPGGPLYRYDKVFFGEIRSGDSGKPCSVNMHVRPLGLSVRYDWARIEAFLRVSGALRELPGIPEILVVDAYSAKENLLRALSQEPYFLLENETVRKIVAHQVNESERLRIDDFEK